MAKRYLKEVGGKIKQRIVQDDVSEFFISGLEKSGFKLDHNYKDGDESEAKVAETAKKLNDTIEKTLKKKAEIKKPIKKVEEVKAIVKKSTEEVVNSEETTKTEGEASKEEKPEEVVEETETESLEDLKNEYIKLYDRPVAVMYSKDTEWIKAKIKARKTETTN